MTHLAAHRLWITVLPLVRSIASNAQPRWRRAFVICEQRRSRLLLISLAPHDPDSAMVTGAGRINIWCYVRPLTTCIQIALALLWRQFHSELDLSNTSLGPLIVTIPGETSVRSEATGVGTWLDFNSADAEACELQSSGSWLCRSCDTPVTPQSTTPLTRRQIGLISDHPRVIRLPSKLTAISSSMGGNSKFRVAVETSAKVEVQVVARVRAALEKNKTYSRGHSQKFSHVLHR
ncbi:hypothetical protein CROQUDRAFT_539536 [Cronartium quercuum f. sp. fusiforme G11]|uniref:Secreted protein n=1 Tax=Cronartium quercuum f. sp. fusiforme G11 TaxID=708437 RepID=A0A9P6NXP7_9BASI|nr:hypothetical protein CROQUDRAFT_539536 [Cronartium quercuum f. sp. fusiforme G11]